MDQFASLAEGILRHRTEINKTIRDCSKPLPLESLNFPSMFVDLSKSPQDFNSPCTPTTDSADDAKYPIATVDEINQLFDDLRSYPSWCEPPKPVPLTNTSTGRSLNRTLSLSNQTLTSHNSTIYASTGSLSSVGVNRNRKNLNQVPQSATITAADRTMSESPMSPKVIEKVDWMKALSQLESLQAMLNKCRSQQLKDPNDETGGVRTRNRLAKKLKQSLMSIEQLKNFLERELVNRSQAVSVSQSANNVAKPMRELNERLEDVTRTIKDFNFIQSKVNFPMEQLCERESRTVFDQEIKELCQLLADIYADDAE